MECVPVLTAGSSDFNGIPGQGTEDVPEHHDNSLPSRPRSYGVDILVGSHKRKRSAGGVFDPGSDSGVDNQHNQQVSRSQFSLSPRGKVTVHPIPRWSFDVNSLLKASKTHEEGSSQPFVVSSSSPSIPHSGQRDDELEETDEDELYKEGHTTGEEDEDPEKGTSFHCHRASGMESRSY